MAEAHDVTTARPAIWRADANSGTPNCLSDLWEHDRLQLTIKGGLKMFRSILIALLLAVSLGGAQAQTWREGKITYHKHGNIIYNNDGQRVGSAATMLFPSDRPHHTCLVFADRIVCN